MEGETWKDEQGEQATPEDMIKYARVRASIMVQFPWAWSPDVVSVRNTMDNGRIVRLAKGSGLLECGEQWVYTSQCKVLAIMGTPDLLTPAQVIEVEKAKHLSALKLKEAQAKTREGMQVLTAEQIAEYIKTCKLPAASGGDCQWFDFPDDDEEDE